MKFYDYIILGVIFIAILVLYFKLRGLDNKTSSTKQESDDIKNKINESNITITNKVTETSSNISSSIKDDVREDFDKLTEKLNRRIEELQSKIENSLKVGLEANTNKLNEFDKELAAFNHSTSKLSNQVTDLEKVLSNNKSIGNFGEFLLEQVLSNYFGDDLKLYGLQVKLGEGTVDSVIYMPDFVVPIDAKFPLTHYKEYIDSDYKDETILKSFKESVKKQIKEIADKYIVKGETSNYACMFVPSDGILQLIHNKCPEVLDFASNLKIVLLSPTTIVPFISSLKIMKYDIERTKKVDEFYKAIDVLGEEMDRLFKREKAVFKDLKSLSDDMKDVEITVGKIEKKYEDIRSLNLGEDEE